MKTVIALFAFIFLLASPAFATPEPAENAAIDHLITYVRDSNLAFIRNGQSYNAVQAADHIASKYAYVKDRIATADQFIDNIASKSSFSGRPYLVCDAEGTEKPVGPWLHAELDKYRKKLNK
jgi:hypothetical protein